MRVAIVGFPYCGKTTLFRAISGIPRDNLRLGEENLAAVKVPEPRLDFLEAMYKPKKRTEVTMEFVDLPGSTEDDAKAGLTKHLPTLRQADALCLVVRAFPSESVPKHADRIDAAADIRMLRDEMLLADLVICDNRVEKLEAAMKKPSKDRKAQETELEILKRCKEALEAERPLVGIVQPGDEEKLLRSFGFLTQKQVVTVVNVGEENAGDAPPVRDDAAQGTYAVCAEIEAEIMEVDPGDRAELMTGWGIESLARDRIIRACYDALGMMCFLTAGEDEVRAWAIPKGATAVEAAGKIHSDLARGFIRAETIAFDDLKAAGNMRDAKAANKVRQEPKNYLVVDGDIMNIKFNV